MAVSFSKAQMRSFESTAERAAGLRGKGFLSFEVDGVVARFTGKGKKFPDASMQKRIGPMLVLGALYLSHARKRLQRGKTATRAEPFKTTPSESTGKDGKARTARGYFVTKLYAALAKSGPGAAGTPGFHASSAAFHAGTKGTPGIVTGGLIRSLVARSSGRSSVVFGADGSSAGSRTGTSSVVRGRGKKKHTVQKAGKFVRNQWKLNSVWKRLRTNMLQPTDQEVQSMAAALALGMHAEFWKSMQGRRVGRSGRLHATVKRQLTLGTDSPFYRKLASQWVRFD
jgi:hypothetical protein